MNFEFLLTFQTRKTIVPEDFWMTRKLVCVIALLAIASMANFVQSDDQERVIWYGTLDGGLAEAKRSGRPIILLSAAPHCQAVSGIW